MFDLDRWQEIFNALAKNKIRTLLTAFGVFWGIFMLVIMLGSGKGLQNGITQGMGDFATNSLFIWTQRTTVAYEGFNKGRRWNFTNDDTKALWDNIPEIGVVAPRIHPPHTETVNFIRGKNTAAFYLSGDYPEYNKIDPVTMLKGRYINDIDIKEKRKVVVIGKRVKETLFPGDEEAIGKYVEIQGVYFQIIGIYKSQHTPNWGGTFQNESACIPFTTLQKTYNLGNIVFYYAITSKPQFSVSQVEEKVRKLLGERHKISPDDRMAFGSNNVEQNFKSMNNLFAGIGFLTWFVGALTLIAGVIGISNIMLIIIKERTKEIGIQRAIGATPIKIMGQIVMESIFLTFIAGLIGMIFGVGIIQLFNMIFMRAASEDSMFTNPEINVQAVVASFILLIISGTLAGLIPAKRAIKIKPIDALRTEI